MNIKQTYQVSCDGGMMTGCLQCPASSSTSAVAEQASGAELGSSTINTPCVASPPSVQGLDDQQATLPSDHELATSTLICQVLGCTEELVKSYCLKKRTCTAHMQAEAVQLTAEDKLYRFCQQCGKFEHVSKFDDNKRSCRARLAKRRSGTRAQLMKKGCSSRFSESTPPTRSNSNAAAELAEVGAAASDLLPLVAANASDELPALFSDWGEQLLEPSSHSTCLPLVSGSVAGLQQQLQPATLHTCQVYGAPDTKDSGCMEIAAVADLRQQATCHTPVPSRSDSATVSGQASAAVALAAEAAAAGRQALSAPLLRLPGSYSSDYGTAAQADDLMLDPASVAQLLEMDEPEHATLDSTVTQADLIIALQQEMEADSAAWQQQPAAQNLLQQRLFTSLHAPAPVSNPTAAVLRAAARCATEAPPPALISMDSLNSQGQVSSGAAGSASDGPAGSGPEASGCSMPLGKLRIDSDPACAASLGTFNCRSAPLPSLPSVISQGRGMLCHNGTLDLPQQHQQEVQPPAMLNRQGSRRTRLQWLVQQVQAELQQCDTEDLCALSEQELATLLHTVLATEGAGSAVSDDTASAVAATVWDGSTGAAPGSAIGGTTAGAPVAHAGSVLAADRSFGLMQQQSSAGSHYMVPASSPCVSLTPYARDIFTSFGCTGSSKTITGGAAHQSPFCKTAPLPILNSTVVSLGGSCPGGYASGLNMQPHAGDAWTCRHAQWQCLKLQHELQQQEQVQVQYQMQEQLARQQLASVLDRAVCVKFSLGQN